MKRWRRHRAIFAFVLLAFTVIDDKPAVGFGLSARGQLRFSCALSEIKGTFTSTSSVYRSNGTCVRHRDQTVMAWTAAGSYETKKKGAVAEEIDVFLTGRSIGKISLRTRCGSGDWFDPWLSAPELQCYKPHVQLRGEIEKDLELLQFIKDKLATEQRPFTSIGTYDRNALMAKRDADLRREAALKPGVQSGAITSSALVRPPTIISPTPGQRFFHLQIVPIRLAPPKGFTPTGYEINIQRYANGNWINHHSFPESAAVMQSATGYTDFGPGGKGPSKKSVLLTSPGAWRLQAQASLPTPLGWGDWVPFTVDASTVGQAATGGVKGAPLSR